jgi:hypothetical protein
MYTVLTLMKDMVLCPLARKISILCDIYRYVQFVQTLRVIRSILKLTFQNVYLKNILKGVLSFKAGCQAVEPPFPPGLYIKKYFP